MASQTQLKESRRLNQSLQDELASAHEQKKALESLLVKKEGEVKEKLEELRQVHGELAAVKKDLASIYLNYREAIRRKDTLEQKLQARARHIRKTVSRLATLREADPQVNLGSIVVQADTKTPPPAAAPQAPAPGKPQIAPPTGKNAIAAKVLNVNNAYGFIVVDLGRSQALRPKDKIRIFNADEYVDEAQVEMVDNTLAALSTGGGASGLKFGDKLVLSINKR